MMTSSAIVATHAFEPSNTDQAFEMAKRLVNSRLLPKSIATAEAAFTIIVTGRELGMTAMQSLRGIHVIEGKPILSADTMLALALRDERCEWFKVVASTNDVASLETKRRGAPESTRMSFSIEDAKMAGLVGKDNWKKYPAAMLRARCIAALARAVYPDIFMGVYEQDELQQPAQHVDVTATVVDNGLYAEFERLLCDATTLDELATIAAAVAAKSGELRKDDLANLKALYVTHKKALSAVEAAKTVTVISEEVAAQ